MKKETRVTHQPKVSLPEGNEPLIAPIYRSVKFSFPSFEASRTRQAREHGFDYTRDGNPTTRQLELLTAELQDRGDAIAVGSGMAAVWLSLLGNVQAGDQVVIFVESYRPTRTAVRRILPRFGVGFVMLGVHDLDAMAGVFEAPQTKLLLFEAPTNPMLQVPDITAIVELARRHGVITVLDNTFAGLHNHGQFGVDFFVHSLTKYGGGHGDVLGGVVIGDAERIAALRPMGVNFGATLDPGVAYLLLRGLKTYYLRYARHSATAQTLAEYLREHALVERVFYPGLPGDPGHALAARQMHDFGGVLSMNLRADKAQTLRFIDALELFTTTSSLGSTESLVAPVKLYWGSDLSEQELAGALIGDSTVRLAVGLEHPDDLIADLEQAFRAAFG